MHVTGQSIAQNFRCFANDTEFGFTKRLKCPKISCDESKLEEDALIIGRAADEAKRNVLC